jgi:ribonuclease D
MTIHLHEGDLPDGLDLGATIAVDTETMGLVTARDRLCLVQLSAGDGDAHLVRLAQQDRPYQAPNLAAQMTDPARLKLFHFARFDIAALKHWLGIDCAPVYCTKIASRLTRTYTDRHGLADLTRELLGVDMSKAQQSSDWGAETLSRAQQEYAASDVLYLHDLKARLDEMLAREGRAELARACMDFLPHRVALDLGGWPEVDIFTH